MWYNTTYDNTSIDTNVFIRVYLYQNKRSPYNFCLPKSTRGTTNLSNYLDDAVVSYVYGMSRTETLTSTTLSFRKTDITV